jgi:hypothetical protein
MSDAGDAGSMIHHEGLTLHPLTPALIAARPDFDPWRHDEQILQHNSGWTDFEGRKQPARLIRRACRPGDALYYWDGPWGALTGSAGIAIVRDGRVIEMFTLWIS